MSPVYETLAVNRGRGEALVRMPDGREVLACMRVRGDAGVVGPLPDGKRLTVPAPDSGRAWTLVTSEGV